MLNPADPRTIIRKTALLVGVLTLSLVLPVNAMQSTLQSRTGRLFGRLYDANGTPISSAVITVFDADNNVHDITTSDAMGVFEFSRLHAGHYELQTSAAGFERVTIQSVTVEANQDVNLNILAVVASAAADIEAPPLFFPGKAVPAEVRSENTQDTKAGILPPRLRRSVNPEYPSTAKDQRVIVTAVLDAVIGTDGVPKSLRVAAPGIDPALADAAVEAVRQWRYDPALSNGQPVEARIPITVKFFNTALVNSASVPENNPSPDPTPTRIRQGVIAQQPTPITQVQPSYPQAAKDARIQGMVILEVLVGKEGDIRDVKVVSGHPMLQQAATEAVSQWKYKPTLLNGEPVEWFTTITLNFSLQQ